MVEGRYEQAYDEFELLGFPSAHPFDLMDVNIKADIFAADMKKHMGRIVTMIGYYVTRKDVTTSNRKLMNFGTWIDEKATSLTPPTSHPPLPATLQRPRPLPHQRQNRR